MVATVAVFLLAVLTIGEAEERAAAARTSTKIVADDSTRESAEAREAARLCGGDERTPTRREWARLEKQIREWANRDADVRSGKVQLIVRQPFGPRAGIDHLSVDAALAPLRQEADRRGGEIEVMLISSARMISKRGKRFSVHVQRQTIFPHEREGRLANLSEVFSLYCVTDDDPPRWLVRFSGSS